MKLSYYTIALLFLFSCSQTGGEENGKDLSSDEAVLEEVKKIEGNDLSKEDICIERPEKFKGLILVGYFAHDRGCDGGLVFYKGKQIDLKGEMPTILKDNGWDEREKREVLALNWVKDVSLVWESPLEYIDNDFKKQNEHTFMPPTVTSEDGEITVAIWVREPSGMTPESAFYLLTVVFSMSEASIIRSQVTDSFSVDFNLDEYED